MTKKILCVDDEANILSGYQRSLRRQFEIETALGGAEALDKIVQNGPYAVLVTDMRMPGMDGVEFLKHAQEAAPDSVRIMLTGNADQQTATDAVNEGRIFRFLNKPCPPEDLAHALAAGLEQHRLITAEKELLEKTLGGTIRVLMEILSLVDPEMFGRAQALRQNMRLLAMEMRSSGASSEKDDVWTLELAAMLAQIGAVTLPSFLIAKIRQGAALNQAEQQLWQRVPEISFNLLRNIPRLEPVAQIVCYQQKQFDGGGVPEDVLSGQAIPRGARMLKILLDLADLEVGKVSRTGAFGMMQRQAGRYDPDILAAARRCLQSAEQAAPEPPAVSVSLKTLRGGQVLTRDIVTLDGKVLLTSGRRLTEVFLEKLQNYAALVGIKEPIYVQATP